MKHVKCGLTVVCVAVIAVHQDVVENVFGFIRVYPVFRVIGNLETGNPETGVSRGSAQNCLPTDRQRLRLLFSFFFF